MSAFDAIWTLLVSLFVLKLLWNMLLPIQQLKASDAKPSATESGISLHPLVELVLLVLSVLALPAILDHWDIASLGRCFLYGVIAIAASYLWMIAIGALANFLKRNRD